MGTMAAVTEAAERAGAVSFTELAARRRGPLRRFFRSRPLAMDWLVAAAYLLLSAPGAVATALAGEPVALALVLLIGAVLLLRRRRPVAVLAAATVLELLLIILQPTSQSATSSMWFALYAVAASRPTRFALAAAAAASLPPMAAFALFLPQLLARAGIPPAVAAELSSTELGYAGWVVAGFIAAANLIATGIGSMVRRDRLHEDEVARWAAEHARFASATERTRIARDMHDVVAHSLSVMIALSDGAAVVVRKDPERAGQVLEKLSATGRTALADMRRVLGVLRGDDAPAAPLEPLQGDGQLAGLIEGFRAAGLPLRMVVSGPELPQDATFRLTVYRIIQESLTNVLRYARGVTRVEVALEREGARVLVRVADDGRGQVPAASLGAGQGITGMRERAAIYHGRVDCGPGTHGGREGWIVEATLYWPGEDGDGTRT